MNKEEYLKLEAMKLTAGRIDRRQFVMAALATGLALPAAFSLADRAMAQTPKKGGNFKLGTGHGSTTDSIDPATYENGMTGLTGFLFGNCLTVMNAEGQLVGELAESYESSDAKTWKFKLKKALPSTMARRLHQKM